MRLRIQHGFCPAMMCFDPVTILTVVAVASMGFGAYEMSQGMKTPSMPGATSAPDPEKAKQDALDAQNKERKMLLASGGKTDQTQGAGMILGSDIHSINLGGS